MPPLPPLPAPYDRELQQRLELAKPEDTARGMFFNGVLNAVKDVPGGGALLEECRALTGERRFVDVFSYPISGFLRLAFPAAALLAPREGGMEAAFRHLGHLGIDDFLKSPAGKTLLLLASSSLRKVMQNATAAYRTAVSYGDRSMEWPGQRHCVMTMKYDFMPHPYHQGLLLRTLEALGGKGVQVKATPTGLLDATYEMTWE